MHTPNPHAVPAYTLFAAHAPQLPDALDDLGELAGVLSDLESHRGTHLLAAILRDSLFEVSRRLRMEAVSGLAQPDPMTAPNR